ncbi:MAG: hypothetical protein ACRC80_30485 [Waterburya sp.]
MQETDKHIAELLRAYLERWRDRIQPQNIEMTVFILSRTVEALCHSAAIKHPEFMSNGQLEQEVSKLIMSYLIKK